MLTLYSYPELFGVADNNGYGLKVFAFLRVGGAARSVALHRRRRGDDRRQRPHHRPPHSQVPADDRRDIDRYGARYRPPDHPHARRPLLGDVVLALEG